MTVETADQIRETLIDEFCRLADIDPEDLTPDATLNSLDVDSLDLMELGQIIEERYGVVLERDDMKDVATVSQAFDIIVDRCLAAAPV